MCFCVISKNRNRNTHVLERGRGIVYSILTELGKQTIRVSNVFVTYCGLVDIQRRDLSQIPYAVLLLFCFAGYHVCVGVAFDCSMNPCNVFDAVHWYLWLVSEL